MNSVKLPLHSRAVLRDPRIILPLFLSLLLPPLSRAEESSFTKLEFGDDLSIEVPRHWYFLDENLRQHIKAGGEAVFKAGGFDVKTGAKKILVAANAYTTYKDTSATMRLSVEARQTLTQEQAAAVTEGELAQSAAELRAAFLQSTEKSGIPQEMKELTTRREKLGKLHTVVVEYLRISKADGKRVFVQVNTIHLGDRAVNLTMSCREAEKPFFLPVLNAIRNSLTIR